LCNYSWFT